MPRHTQFVIYFSWSSAIAGLYNWSLPQPAKQLEKPVSLSQWNYLALQKLPKPSASYGGRRGEPIPTYYLLEKLVCLIASLILRCLLRQLQLHFWCVCIISWVGNSWNHSTQWSKKKKKNKVKKKRSPWNHWSVKTRLIAAFGNDSNGIFIFLRPLWEFSLCDSSTASAEIRWPILLASLTNWIRSCSPVAAGIWRQSHRGMQSQSLPLSFSLSL